MSREKEILKYLSERFQEEITTMADDLSLGKAKDFGDYKYSCGIVRGLLIANNYLIETAERLENDDD